MELTRELWQSIRQIEDPTRRKLGETAYEMLFQPMWEEAVNEQYYIDYPHRRPDPEAENRKVQERLANVPPVILQAAYNKVRKEEQGPLVLLEDERGRNGANRQVPEPGDGNAADLKERPDEAAGFQKKHLQASEKETKTTSAPPQADLAQQPDKTSMLAEKNSSEKTLQTFQNAEENYIINPGSALDNFSRISQPHSSAEDLAKANPNYKQGAEYRENCQRCVPAYELRPRGYDVQAKPAQVTANGKISPAELLTSLMHLHKRSQEASFLRE